VRIDDFKYRFIDQPAGWLGEKTKLDGAHPDQPAPRSVRAHAGGSGTKFGAQQYFDWFNRILALRCLSVQQVEKLAMTAIEFPPCRGARASTSML